MFKCKVCSYKCNLKRHFIEHKKIHKRVRQSCGLCTSTFSYRSSLSRHLRNIHDLRSESSDTSSDDEIFMKSVNASKNKTNDDTMQGIDEDRKPDKRLLAAQFNVPNLQSESPVTDTSSDDEIVMKSVNASKNKTKDDTAVHSENVPKGNKNQSISTSKKRYSLRNLYEDYLEVNNSNDRMMDWATHAGLLIRHLDLEFPVIALLMADIQTDYSIPIDENLIQMLHQDSPFCTESLQHHTQYYIIVQLVYGLKKLFEIDAEDIRSHRKSNWMKNTITILEYFKFNDDTIDFIIERMENFI